MKCFCKWLVTSNSLNFAPLWRLSTLLEVFPKVAAVVVEVEKLVGSGRGFGCSLRTQPGFLSFCNCYCLFVWDEKDERKAEQQRSEKIRPSST